MGMIRGKVFLDREIIDMKPEVNGPMPWKKCPKTGKWYDRETGKEVNVQSITLAELMESEGYCKECGLKHD